MDLEKTDNQIFKLINQEAKRQLNKMMLIPSENYTSLAVRQAVGSILCNKYSEGEPGKRYYQGNEIIDEIELLVNQRALKVFNLSDKKWHVNVKAVSASIANLSVISALLEPGNKIMAMNLPDGGHLSHGWDLKDGRKVTFSSKIFKTVRYKVDPQTEIFNYDAIAKQAKREKPQLLISGGTAYARQIDHKKMASIAKSVNAYYLADVAHEAGLIAGKVNKSPFPYADVVTMSTQKTLRGPRGAMIICKQELASQIDRAIFPGLQGGPFNHVIAGIGACLKEALSPKFKTYQKQVIKNARTLANELKKYGFHVVSGGTDKHLILIDLRNKKIDGHKSAKLLDQAGLVLNKNTVPGETGSPFRPSGIRLGTPAVTTLGMKEKHMQQIALWIKEVLLDKRNSASVLKDVKKLMSNIKA